MSLGGTSSTALLPFQQPDQLTSPHRHCPRWQGSSQPAASFLFPSLCFRSRQTRAWRGAAAGVGVGSAARWVLRLPPGSSPCLRVPSAGARSPLCGARFVPGLQGIW